MELSAGLSGLPKMGSRAGYIIPFNHAPRLRASYLRLRNTIAGHFKDYLWKKQFIVALPKLGAQQKCLSKQHLTWQK